MGVGPMTPVEALFEAYYDDLLRYALRRVAEPADAADVVAETWATAWRRRDQLPAGAEARLWLLGVARRVLANQRRGQLRRSALVDRLRVDLAGDAARFTAPDSPVTRALDRLRPGDRDLLLMQVWEGLSGAEIAVVLGCSPTAVRVRTHRARARLRALLTSPALDPRPCDLEPDGSTGGLR